MPTSAHHTVVPAPDLADSEIIKAHDPEHSGKPQSLHLATSDSRRPRLRPPNAKQSSGIAIAILPLGLEHSSRYTYPNVDLCCPPQNSSPNFDRVGFHLATSVGSRQLAPSPPLLNVAVELPSLSGYRVEVRKQPVRLHYLPGQQLPFASRDRRHGRPRAALCLDADTDGRLLSSNFRASGEVSQLTPHTQITTTAPQSYSEHSETPRLGRAGQVRAVTRNEGKLPQQRTTTLHPPRTCKPQGTN